MRIPSTVSDQYKCSACRVIKPLSAFGRDKQSKRGHKYKCKQCTNEARRGRFAKDNRRRYLKRKYGIDENQFREMRERQRGRCAVCGQIGEKRSGGKRAKDSTDLYVDHDHVSGEVRGLLCHKCNVAIGLLYDDPQRMERAAMYVRGMPVEFLLGAV